MPADRTGTTRMGMTYLFVAIGGALGTTLRFWISGLIANWVGPTFPWGTLVINITGSFAIGFFATLTAPEGRVFVPGEWRQFFMSAFAAATPRSPRSACRP